jgi:serine/threonine protein kinase
MSEATLSGADGDQHESGSPRQQRRSSSLAKWMEDEPRPLNELMPIMVGVLEAIAKANATEERLCDLDPHRVMVKSDGGVAISTHRPFDASKTFSISSAKYTSPEYLDEKVPNKFKLSNAYVSGFLFYELLLGRKFFEAQFGGLSQSGNLGWLAWHADIKQRAIPLSETNRYPVFVCRVIDRMIEKNPANRLVDIEGVARAFGNVSNVTMVHKIVRDPSALQAPGVGAAMVRRESKLRPWLAALGEQRLWKSLWKHVAPNEPQLRRGSIEELDHMFSEAEEKFKKLGSFFSASQARGPKADG